MATDRTHLMTGALSAALLLGDFASAAAQSAAPAAGLEEIVVTARRREETLQKVPLAVTAFNADRLRETQVNTVNELTFLVPSLNITNASIRNAGNLAIRGISGTYGSARTSSTSTYLNDVPVDHTGPGIFFDLENVQVLKGPQGTAFGRSSIGGSILLVSRRPSDRFEGHAQVSIGNYDFKEVEAAVNVPLAGDRLAVRVAAQHSHRDGFTTVLATGEKLDGRDYRVARISVLAKPTETVENLLTYNWRDTNASGTGATLGQVDPMGLGGFLLFLYPTLPALLQQQRDLGPRRIAAISPDHTSDKSRLQVVTDTLTWQVADTLSVKNIFGWQLNQARSFYDHDGTALGALNFMPPEVKWTTQTRTVSDEVQLHGTHFDKRLDWFAGYYWEYSAPYRDKEGGNTQGVVDQGDLHCTKGVAAQPGFLTQDQWTYSYVDCTGNRVRSHGLYAQGSLDLSDLLLDGLRLTAGYRRTRDRIEVATEAYQRLPTGSLICNTLFADRNCRSVLNANFSAPGYTVGLDWQVAPDKLLYVANRRAYKPGGINGVDAAGNRLPNYKEETLTDVEVGLKADWMLGGRPLRTNLALYYGWYDDIQQTTVFFNTATTTSQSLIANAATAIAKGGELEVQFLPTDALLLQVTYAYNDLKFDRFMGFDPVTLRLVDRSHEKFPYLLKSKVGLMARYTLPLDERLGSVSVSTSWSRQGKLNLTPNLEPGSVEGPVLLGSARLDWNHVAGYPVDLGLFVTNLTNRTYRTGSFTIYSSFGFSSDVWGEPRMYGAQLRYRFGG